MISYMVKRHFLYFLFILMFDIIIEVYNTNGVTAMIM